MTHAATLTQDGESRATIVVEAEPLERTVAAVADLADYLERISGAKIAVVNDGEPVDTPVTIYVGLQHESLAEKFPGVELSFTGFDETLIVCHGDNVLLVGGDGKLGGSNAQQGTSQAVYQFIEKYLGVRWLWPGELGEDVPSTPTIAIDDVVDRYAPPLEQRYLRILDYDNFHNAHADYRGSRDDALEVGRRLTEQSLDWRRRQRADVYWVRAGHAFTDWWERYHEEHPEYFAMLPDGQRRLCTPPDRVKLCISNPAVSDQWLANAIETLDAEPTRRLISVSPNDNQYQGYCVCENCTAMDTKDTSVKTMLPLYHDREGPRVYDHVSLTDRFARFWNICARKLKDHYTDREAFVGAWAYGAYRTPPQEVQLEDNVIVGFISFGTLSVSERYDEAPEKAAWEGWADHIKYLVWRPNFFYPDRGMPALFTKAFADDFAWLADHKMIGLDLDIVYGHWAMQGLQYYVIAKLAWDPHRDLDDIIDDYTTHAFGPGAGAMRTYFDKLEQAYLDRAKPGESIHDISRIDSLPTVYSPQFRGELRGLIEEAKSAVGDAERGDLYRKRIDFFEAGLTFLDLHVAAIEAMTAYRTADEGPQREAAYKAAMAAGNKRDAFLDAQLDDFTINTTWGFHNWGPTRAVDNAYGPPAEVDEWKGDY